MSCVPNVPTQDLVVLFSSRYQGSGSLRHGLVRPTHELSLLYIARSSRANASLPSSSIRFANLAAGSSDSSADCANCATRPKKSSTIVFPRRRETSFYPLWLRLKLLTNPKLFGIWIFFIVSTIVIEIAIAIFFKEFLKDVKMTFLKFGSDFDDSFITFKN